MKKCPFCAEDIQEEAIKCRFCHEILAPEVPRPSAQVAWYRNGYSIWISYVILFPISVLWCVPLTLTHPRWSSVTKIVSCLIMIGLAWALTSATVHFMGNIQEYYNSTGLKLI